MVNSTTPQVTTSGVVVNKVYAVNGVIDTIAQFATPYQDPATNQVSTAGIPSLTTQQSETVWTSNFVDDVVNTSYQLQFNFSNTSYVNYVQFDILSVPCQYFLYNGTTDSSNLLTTGVIQGDGTFFEHQELTLSQTYQFGSTNSLILVINKIATGTQYQFQVKNFLTKLRVQNIQNLTISGSVVNSLTSQNALGFVENFTPIVYSTNYINDSTPTTYWKCEPQPVGDAIVYFILDLGSLQSFDRIYIDPLYSNNVFNLYYSLDQTYWTPVPQDFRLRKGFYELPVITTRYLKFEFTQLTPEPYQLPFDYVTHTINVFPDWVDQYYTNIERLVPDTLSQIYSQGNAPSNAAYNTQISSPTLIGAVTDNLTGSAFGTTNIATSNSFNASQTQITDPTISYKTVQNVSTVGSTYNPNTDVAFTIRRFPYTTTHNYKQVTFNQTWREAYFTGIKSLFIYKTLYNKTLDYREFTDYLMSTSGTLVNTGTSTMKFIQPQIVTSGGVSTISGGGYSGLTGSQLVTNTLNTVTPYQSFKFAVLSSDWASFFTDPQVTLRANSLSLLGVTTSGVTSQNVLPTNTSYNIWQLTPTGTPSQTFIQSTTGGGSNLLTTSEALFASGGWTGTNPTTTSISGQTWVSIPGGFVQTAGTAYGESTQGGNTYGSPNSLANPATALYTFLVTASGSGTVTVQTVYSGSNAGGPFAVASGYSVAISGSTSIVFPTTQYSGATRANFILQVSGSSGSGITFSNAGYFSGYTTSWVTPLATSGLRMSAVSRVFLPNTNNGSYRCSLYSGNTELAYRQYPSLPLKTWVDLEVPFTLVSGFYNYNNFSVRLTQNNSNEAYQVALLGVFYNPVSWEYSSDGGAGTSWNYITTGINDPYANIALVSGSNQLQLRATVHQDGTIINGFTVVPNLQQSPFYSTTAINYLGDPRVNELSWKSAPQQRPLFQLGTELHPARYDMAILMGIVNQFRLD